MRNVLWVPFVCGLVLVLTSGVGATQRPPEKQDAVAGQQKDHRQASATDTVNIGGVLYASALVKRAIPPKDCFSIPFGKKENEIGRLENGKTGKGIDAGPPFQPFSYQVAENDDLWVLDNPNRFLKCFRKDGAFSRKVPLDNRLFADQTLGVWAFAVATDGFVLRVEYEPNEVKTVKISGKGKILHECKDPKNPRGYLPHVIGISPQGELAIPALDFLVRLDQHGKELMSLKKDSSIFFSPFFLPTGALVGMKLGDNTLTILKENPEKPGKAEGIFELAKGEHTSFSCHDILGTDRQGNIFLHVGIQDDDWIETGEDATNNGPFSANSINRISPDGDDLGSCSYLFQHAGDDMVVSPSGEVYTFIHAPKAIKVKKWSFGRP